MSRLSGPDGRPSKLPGHARRDAGSRVTSLPDLSVCARVAVIPLVSPSAGERETKALIGARRLEIAGKIANARTTSFGALIAVMAARALG